MGTKTSYSSIVVSVYRMSYKPPWKRLFTFIFILCVSMFSYKNKRRKVTSNNVLTWFKLIYIGLNLVKTRKFLIKYNNLI